MTKKEIFVLAVQTAATVYAARSTDNEVETSDLGHAITAAYVVAYAAQIPDEVIEGCAGSAADMARGYIKHHYEFNYQRPEWMDVLFEDRYRDRVWR